VSGGELGPADVAMIDQAVAEGGGELARLQLVMQRRIADAGTAQARCDMAAYLLTFSQAHLAGLVLAAVSVEAQ
jgi:hypothetical protein